MKRHAEEAAHGNVQAESGGRFGTQAFRAAVDRLFGPGAASAVDALTQAEVFARVADTSEPIVALETALILAAIAARGTRPAIHAEVARSILMMEFQLEYGAKATSDRKGLRAASAPPEKDYFGTQLESDMLALRSAAGATSTMAVTVGWTRHGDCIGLVHYPERERTFAYSTAHLLRNTQPGIVRLGMLEFDFLKRFDVSPATMKSFVELAFGGRGEDLPAIEYPIRGTING